MTTPTFSTLNPGTGGDKVLVDSALGTLDGATPPAGTVAQIVELAAVNSGFSPTYSGPDVEGITRLRADPEGNLAVRGPVLTDEGTFRLNFANTSLAVAIGSVTVSGAIVTGTGFLAADLHKNDYFKVAADADTAYVQIESLDSDTQLTLVSAYVGAASGTGNRAVMAPVVGTGGAVAVASGQATLTAGTTIAAKTGVVRLLDYAPLVYRCRSSVSQRIVNQAFLSGLREDAATPRWFARFRFEGTVNTTVICETGRNPTGAPSASETESTTVTIPFGATSAALLETRIEQLTESVLFYIGDIRVAKHSKVIPQQHDTMMAAAEWVNAGTAPASSSTATLDFLTGKNHNKLEVGLLSDSEQIVGVQPPAQMFSYTAGAVVIPINTNIIEIDCSQLRSLSILSGSVGTTGVVTGAWSNDGTTDWITATLVSEVGATSTTFTGASALLRTTSVRARYFRLRMTTATTAAGATRINVAGFQQDITPAITTQPVSGTVTATVTGATQLPVTPTTATTNSAATTNATSTKNTAGTLWSVAVSNINAAARYLKLYNKASAPTVGTDVPILTIPIPAGGVVQINGGSNGIRFATGIAWALTAGAADSDTAAVAASEHKVVISYT